MDTLAFGYILPTTGWIRDFNPLETCAARRTRQKKPDGQSHQAFLCICFPARLLRSAVFFRFLRSICQFRRQKALNIRNSPAHLFDIVCRVHCLSLQAHYTFRQLSLDIRHRQRDFPHASQKQSVHSPKTNGFPSIRTAIQIWCMQAGQSQ